ncbi:MULTISPECIES: preprotein translocase subunit YajC [Paenisporosarcina]|jgi:preprotein translocase subunit YajC|uniref:Preprotein translocase subunit YajC n=1 Tax=Paenisporosarcina quisquiliarum TaxID=365346 RepID=A0A9X3RCG5_9BACL|nr:preprotein translocase subunit YajC [Paenisporosarcina quisquiliarum]MCZ8536144.1 preprotein translocase subunit YajC [Paenisporosarcina quisquiliarum]
METLIGLMPIILMFVVMWFFIIRPAQKRQKTTASMQSSLKRGDRIVTVGGLHALVDAVDDSTVFVTVADGTRLQFERAAVARVLDASPAL